MSTAPIRSGRTHRTSPPRAFLSPATRAAVARRGGGAVVTARPQAASSATIRSASRRWQVPRAAARRAAAASPSATASPCASPDCSSSAWPSVCPRFSARRGPASRKSAVTSRPFTLTAPSIHDAQGRSRAPGTGRSARPRASRFARSGARASRLRNRDGEPITAALTVSARPQRQSRRVSVPSSPGSTSTHPAGWKAPTGFFNAPRSTAVLPPRPASTAASSVVGAAAKATPRCQVAAAKPARSSTAPPPTPTTVPSRGSPRAASHRQTRSRLATVLAVSPPGTTRQGRGDPPPSRSTAARRPPCSRTTARSTTATAGLRPSLPASRSSAAASPR